MKPRLLFPLVAVAIGACAPGRTSPPATPAPAPVPPPAAEAPAPAASTLAEAPRDWQLLDESTDHVPGISALRAERELLAGRQPRRTVLVAVIDGGIDTAHVDLRPVLWTNAKEIGGNGKDDDGDGYVDDVRGWDFIGGPNGRDVNYDTFEVTRQYVHCGGGAQGISLDTLSATEKSRCAKIAADFDKQRSEATQTLPRVLAIGDALGRATTVLRKALGTDSLTTTSVRNLTDASPEVLEARRVYLELAAHGITPDVIADARKEYEAQVKFQLNPSFNPRPIVGDDFDDVTQRVYGNADVMGPDALHGTHVSGIIGAVRGNGNGMRGIAPAVRIMMVRTVPNGDERDKDVANAIRYAVDHGAQVINMSFGKPYSPRKKVVDDAVRYADAHGVLMIHAAGNDGKDLASAPDFPTPVYDGGGTARNWITVGASSWKGADSLAASFSNYGHEQVDVFAPGVDIYSTVPGNQYKRESGTSMAAPVVTGLAAVLMSYFPNLTAADVKHIILASATRYDSVMVGRPGSESGERVPFGTLSVTGGIVNEYAAVKMAEQMTAARP